MTVQRVPSVLQALAVVALASAPQLPASAAQPRLPSELKVPPPAPPDPTARAEWLGRLVGRFRWEGMVDTNPAGSSPDDSVSVRGVSDCVAVGQGPGVHCILNVTWDELWTPAGTALTVPYLAPAMVMFGMHGERDIRYLQVDNKGIAEAGRGPVDQSRVTLRAPCVNVSTADAVRVSQAANPGSDLGAAPAAAEGASGDGGAEPLAPAGVGDVVSLPGLSDVSPSTGCQMATYIDARRGSNVIFIRVTFGDRMSPATEYLFTLRRQLAEDAPVLPRVPARN